MNLLFGLPPFFKIIFNIHHVFMMIILCAMPPFLWKFLFAAGKAVAWFKYVFKNTKWYRWVCMLTTIFLALIFWFTDVKLIARVTHRPYSITCQCIMFALQNLEAGMKFQPLETLNWYVIISFHYFIIIMPYFFFFFLQTGIIL